MTPPTRDQFNCQPMYTVPMSPQTENGNRESPIEYGKKNADLAEIMVDDIVNTPIKTKKLVNFDKVGKNHASPSSGYDVSSSESPKQAPIVGILRDKNNSKTSKFSIEKIMIDECQLIPELIDVLYVPKPPSYENDRQATNPSTDSLDSNISNIA